MSVWEALRLVLTFHHFSGSCVTVVLVDLPAPSRDLTAAVGGRRLGAPRWVSLKLSPSLSIVLL